MQGSIQAVMKSHINNVNLDILKIFLKYCSLPIYGIEFKHYLMLINDLDLGINEENRSFTNEISAVFKKFSQKECTSYFIFFKNFLKSLKALYEV